MKTCIIISGGAFTRIPEEVLNSYVIACDKGYAYAKKQNIVPNLIIGDLDSYEGDLPAGVEVVKYPPEKDDTDTMIGVKTAIERGFRDLRIFCAFGGRLDHLYANFQTVIYAAKQGVNCRMEDENNVVFAVGKETVKLPRKEGYSLSLFAVTDVCQGVCVKGAKYPLENAKLTNSFPLGVSNEWKEDVVEICVQEGIMLIILSKVLDTLQEKEK